jgi:diaminopimelate epimerase
MKFTKMHGLGNDFIVIDATQQKVALDEEICRKMAHRHFGIGCDQILLVEPPLQPNTDFNFRIFNADGTEAGACGNGARCFAHFVREKGLSKHERLRISTSADILELHLLETGQVEVDMGSPIFEPERIPFQAQQRSNTYSLEVDGEQLIIGSLSMGNPHAVLIVPDTTQAQVAHLGPAIENHHRFPERTNVGFMQIINRQEIKLRVYERGVGETLACGSGACAAVVSGRQRELLEEEVTVHLPGGDLVVKWHSEGQPVLMRGPAQTVYEGTIAL